MDLTTVLSFLGATGLFSIFVVLMINKDKWKIAPVVGGGILALLLVTTFPKLPQATQDGISGFVNAVTHPK